MKQPTPVFLAKLAELAGAHLQGDGTIPISGVATLQNARSGQISFLANPRYRKFLRMTQASAVILAPQDADECRTAALIADNPQLAYARVATAFAASSRQASGIHPSAWVSPEAVLDESVSVGPCSVVEAGAKLAAGVWIGPQCVVGQDTQIDVDSILTAKVTVCHNVFIGKRVRIHPGAVVGADGFGLANDGGRWVKIPQLGSVRIDDDVEIGANTTIDRGALEDTVIEEGVKLDNLIQIAHNVHIGAHTAIAGCVGIAGSVRIGRYCSLAGGVGIAGHLTIADRVHITGMSLVTKSITEPGVYSSGLPVEPNRLWNKISARLRRLDEFARRLAELERKLTSRSDQE